MAKKEYIIKISFAQTFEKDIHTVHECNFENMQQFINASYIAKSLSLFM